MRSIIATIALVVFGQLAQVQLPDDQPAPPQEVPRMREIGEPEKPKIDPQYGSTILIASLHRPHEIGEPEQKLGIQEYIILVGLVLIITWAFLRPPRQRNR